MTSGLGVGQDILHYATRNIWFRKNEYLWYSWDGTSLFCNLNDNLYSFLFSCSRLGNVRFQAFRNYDFILKKEKKNTEKMFLLRQLYFMFFAQFSNFSSVLTFQNAFQKLFCNHKEKKPTYNQNVLWTHAISQFTEVGRRLSYVNFETIDGNEYFWFARLSAKMQFHLKQKHAF